MKFYNRAQSDAINHAKEVFPQESCGIIVDNQYIKLDNISSKPMESFAFHPSVLIEYSGRIQYVVHSHPEGSGAEALDCPSSADMQQQMNMLLPWMVVVLKHSGEVDVFTFGEKPPPLIGRPFRHGVTDCYSLVRDAFALGHIDGIEDIEPRTLPDFPRDWGWWNVAGVDLYEKNFRGAGFRKLDKDEILEPWDLMLCNVGSAGGSPNHAIVYLGNNLGMHHVGSWSKPYDVSRLSKRESIGRWLPHVVYRIRPEWVRPRNGVADAAP